MNGAWFLLIMLYGVRELNMCIPKQRAYLVKYTRKVYTGELFQDVRGNWVKDELMFEIKEDECVVVSKSSGIKWSDLLRKIKNIDNIFEIKSIEKVGDIYP